MKKNRSKKPAAGKLTKPAAKRSLSRKSVPRKPAAANQGSGRDSLNAVIVELAAIAVDLRETTLALQALLEREEEAEPGEVTAVVVTETEPPEGFEDEP
jgi:hypothetical protein